MSQRAWERQVKAFGQGRINNKEIPMDKPMASLSWKPVKKGKRFCSPACGGGCTVEAYLEAKKAAKQLAKTLGKGWKPDVWENLGWHWRAVNGVLKVHPSYGRYTAYLGKADSPGGRWAGHGKTPQEAVKKVIAIARKELEGIAVILKEVEVA